MMSAQISVPNVEVAQIMRPELVNKDRSTIELNTEKGCTFKISAKDATALRASVNAAMQAITVYYKVRSL